MKRRLAAAVTAVVLATSVSVSAQRWVAPYRDGLKAYQDQKWDEAIQFFTRAVREDPVQMVRKPTNERLYPEPFYFPYLYLGAAYLKKGQLDEAQANLDRAARDQGTMPQEQRDLLRAARDELAARRPRPAPPPTPPPDPARDNPPPTPPPPPPPPTKSAFEQAADAAIEELGARRFGAALAALDRLRGQNPAEFNRLNLGPRRDEAARGRAAELANDGQRALSANNLADARRLFTEANNLSRGTGDAGLGEVARREAANNAAAAEAEAARLVRDGKVRVTRREYGEAENFFREATEKDPNNREARELLDKSRQFTQLANEAKAYQRQGKLAEAGGPLRQAKDLDAARYASDPALAAIERALAAVPKTDTLRAGLEACLTGNSADAIGILAPIAQNPAGLDTRLRAHVHAWLGVSYATESLLATTDAARADARGKALAQFRAALQTQADYQLSETLVSPRIREIWREASRR